MLMYIFFMQNNTPLTRRKKIPVNTWFYYEPKFGELFQTGKLRNDSVIKK